MSQSDTTIIDDNIDAGFTDVTAEDTVDEMVDKARVRQIYTQRQQIKRAFQQAPAMRLENPHISREQVTYIIDQAVREYVDDLRPIMVKAAKSGKTEHNYWNGDEYPIQADITVPDNVHDINADAYRSPGHEDWSPNPHGVTITGRGASAIFKVDGFIELEWAYRKEHRSQPTETDTIQVLRPLPRSYLRQVRNVCNDFLQAVDFDVSIGGGTRDVEAVPK